MERSLATPTDGGSVEHTAPRSLDSRSERSRKTVVYLQDACFEHRLIRSEASGHPEHPKRLRAVRLGVAAAIARLEELANRTSATVSTESATYNTGDDAKEDDLAAAISRMNLVSDSILSKDLFVPVVNSTASVNMLNHPALELIHGKLYLKNLASWIAKSSEMIDKGFSEIPNGLSQGDLFLCPGSIDAIQGSIGTLCEAVDTVVRSSRPSSEPESTTNTEVGASRAFVVVRPPGHHCDDHTPSGFCFVNNVAIGAAHAHLRHNIKRVVIFDIDLHHGNGTQAIAWQINQQTHFRMLDAAYSNVRLPSKAGLRMYYGSIHDVLSYPCEDGTIDMVQAASASIHGAHGQYIENVHLQQYTSEAHFWDVLYKDTYSKILRKAESFIEDTGSADDALVFISCGFDACEHEYPYMSRHDRKVPASFYYRFTRDACSFADKYAGGRIVSVLEGGYSDRALISGSMAHLCGLTDVSGLHSTVDENWWAVENLSKLEHVIKKRRGPRESLSDSHNNKPPEAWVERTTSIFSTLDTTPAHKLEPSSSRNAVNVPPSSSMTLRERKKPTSSAEPTPASSPNKNDKKGRAKGRTSDVAQRRPVKSSSSSDENVGERSEGPTGVKEDVFAEPSQGGEPKKLPRVILRLGPHPDSSQQP